MPSVSAILTSRSIFFQDCWSIGPAFSEELDNEGLSRVGSRKGTKECGTKGMYRGFVMADIGGTMRFLKLCDLCSHLIGRGISCPLLNSVLIN